MNDKLKQLEIMLLEARSTTMSATAIENIDACIAMIERMKSIAKLYEEAIMGTKPWYLSKTIWTGVAIVLIAAYNAASLQFGLPAIPEWIFALLGAFGIYTRTAVTTKIG